MTRDLAAELKALEVEPASEGLKPCPFCGGEALVRWQNGDEPAAYDAVICVAGCVEVGEVMTRETWNTRAADPRLAALVALCRELIAENERLTVQLFERAAVDVEANIAELRKIKHGRIRGGGQR